MRLLSIILLLITSFSLSIAQDSKINPNGHNVFYHKTGEKSSEGHMKNGKPVGYWFTYYENGNIKSEGNRKDFMLDSIWKFYSEDGIPVKHITYEKDKRNGYTYNFYKEGFLKSREHYVDNIKEGYAYHYYPGGQTKKKIPFQDGKEAGTGYEYAKDGTITAIMYYKHGFIERKEEINRRDRKGRKQDVWKEFYPCPADTCDDPVVKWEGTFVDDKRHGYFREYSRKGVLLNTNKYENGVMVENAEELINLEIKSTYYSNGKMKTMGSYKEGIPEGVFREYSKEDGRVIASKIYHNGVIMGEGIVDEKGARQGPWKEYYPDGSLRAEGEYQDGMRYGDWVFYFRDGTVEQKGAYTKGEKPHGKWEWYYPNGSLEREEHFRRGLEDGMSVDYDKEGNEIAKGEFIDGEKEGFWFYHIGFHRQEGEYAAGKKQGEWKHYYDDGTKSFEGSFLDDLPVDKHTYYYSNGKKMLEGRYEGGLKDKEWKRYYEEDGSLMLRIDYEMGRVKKIDGVKVKPEVTGEMDILD